MLLIIFEGGVKINIRRVKYIWFTFAVLLKNIATACSIRTYIMAVVKE